MRASWVACICLAIERVKLHRLSLAKRSGTTH